MYSEIHEDDKFQGRDELVSSPVVLRASADVIDPEDPETWGKVGRNSACPCESGKKYKHCHGAF